jgi:hypothetical protein
VNFAIRDLVCADLSVAHCLALRIFASPVVCASGQRNPDFSDSRPSVPVQLSPSFSVACFHDEIRPPVIRDRSGASAPVVS